MTRKFAAAIALTLLSTGATFSQVPLSIDAFASWKPASAYINPTPTRTLQANDPTSPVVITGSKLVQSAYGTDINIEVLGRNSVSEYAFIRIRCQVFDADDKSLGEFSEDFTSGGGSHNIVIVQGYYQRPVMRFFRRIDNADHASCRFATDSDPLPQISADNVKAEMISIYSVQISNQSSFYLAQVEIKCLGYKNGRSVNTTYTVGGGVGGFGFPPGFVNPETPLTDVSSTRSCSVSAVTVKKAPNMASGARGNK